MKRVAFALCILLVMSGLLEGHARQHASALQGLILPSQLSRSSSSVGFLEWLGHFHFLFLHFPIALIIMTVVAEWLWIWFANPVFNHAARFMIVSAAVFAIPTALFGFALGYHQTYEGLDLELYTWHRFFGVLTVGLVTVTAVLKERHARQPATSLVGYYSCLFLLFLSINLTGVFGGSLAFGLDVW